MRLASVTRKSSPRARCRRRERDCPPTSSIDIARHEIVDRHGCSHAVAQHTGGQRERLLELLDGGRGPVLLKEAEQRAAQHDEDNDPGIDPFLQRQRDHGAEDENEHERAFELPQSQAKSVGAAVLLDGIRAVALEPAQGLGLESPSGRVPSMVISSAVSTAQ